MSRYDFWLNQPRTLRNSVGYLMFEGAPSIQHAGFANPFAIFEERSLEEIVATIKHKNKTSVFFSIVW